jgi:hypothetical protein
MNLDDYQKEAEIDVKLDTSHIDRCAAELPTKINKWLRYSNKEKIKLKSFEQDRDRIRRVLYAHYAGYSADPYQYNIDRVEIKEFINGDENFQDAEQVVTVQKIICDYIRDVVDTLNKSGFSINNYISWQKFQAGEY